jgi:succinate dehydrogenase / fumarate reductase membrane anchor subunit
LLLLFLVLLHGWFTHFALIGDVQAGIHEEVVLYDIVKGRLTQTVFIILDFSLLAVVLYHGLNGIRNILLEWKPVAQQQLAVALSLWALGIVAFFFGARALLVFIL